MVKDTLQLVAWMVIGWLAGFFLALILPSRRPR